MTSTRPWCAGYAWWYERYAPGDELLESCQEERVKRQAWEDAGPMAPGSGGDENTVIIATLVASSFTSTL